MAETSMDTAFSLFVQIQPMYGIEQKTGFKRRKKAKHYFKHA